MASEQDFKLSRVGKRPIDLPGGAQVTLQGQRATVKGPKGTLTREFPSVVTLEQEGSVLHVRVSTADRQTRAYQGMTRALLQNMVTGVTAGFQRVLEVSGVGYRAEMKGTNHIMFLLGYSHPIMYELPASVTAEVSKDNKITLRSIDKEQLGHAAAKIRSFRAPEPYKGKGIKYAEEHIRRKAGKAAAR